MIRISSVENIRIIFRQQQQKNGTQRENKSTDKLINGFFVLQHSRLFSKAESVEC